MIENFNPFICLGGKNEKINHIAEAAIEMNLTCNDLKKDLNLSDGDVVDMLQLVMDRFKSRNAIWEINKFVKDILFEIDKYDSVNFLWSDLIEKFGFNKSKQIVSQAIDLQRMNGKKDTTIPIIFTGTAGLALISIDFLKNEALSKNIKENQVLIFNRKEKLFQILQETN